MKYSGSKQYRAIGINGTIFKRRDMQERLAASARRQGFTSPLWITSATVRKKELELVSQSERPTIVHMERFSSGRSEANDWGKGPESKGVSVELSLYNIEQTKEAAAFISMEMVRPFRPLPPSHISTNTGEGSGSSPRSFQPCIPLSVNITAGILQDPVSGRIFRDVHGHDAAEAVARVASVPLTIYLAGGDKRHQRIQDVKEKTNNLFSNTDTNTNTSKLSYPPMSAESAALLGFSPLGAKAHRHVFIDRPIVIPPSHWEAKSADTRNVVISSQTSSSLCHPLTPCYLCWATAEDFLDSFGMTIVSPPNTSSSSQSSLHSYFPLPTASTSPYSSGEISAFKHSVFSVTAPSKKYGGRRVRFYCSIHTECPAYFAAAASYSQDKNLLAVTPTSDLRSLTTGTTEGVTGSDCRLAPNTLPLLPPLSFNFTPTFVNDLLDTKLRTSTKNEKFYKQKSLAVNALRRLHVRNQLLAYFDHTYCSLPLCSSKNRTAFDIGSDVSEATTNSLKFDEENGNKCILNSTQITAISSSHTNDLHKRDQSKPSDIAHLSLSPRISPYLHTLAPQALHEAISSYFNSPLHLVFGNKREFAALRSPVVIPTTNDGDSPLSLSLSTTYKDKLMIPSYDNYDASSSSSSSNISVRNSLSVSDTPKTTTKSAINRPTVLPSVMSLATCVMDDYGSATTWYNALHTSHPERVLERLNVLSETVPMQKRSSVTTPILPECPGSKPADVPPPLVNTSEHLLNMHKI